MVTRNTDGAGLSRRITFGAFTDDKDDDPDGASDPDTPLTAKTPKLPPGELGKLLPKAERMTGETMTVSLPLMIDRVVCMCDLVEMKANFQSKFKEEEIIQKLNEIAMQKENISYHLNKLIMKLNPTAATKQLKPKTSKTLKEALDQLKSSTPLLKGNCDMLVEVVKMKKASGSSEVNFDEEGMAIFLEIEPAIQFVFSRALALNEI